MSTNDSPLSDSKIRFEPVPCQEGFTLRDPSNGQAMHSAIGPETEAELIFIQPSQLSKKLRNAERSAEPLVLWDVGMGIAANSLAAWKLANEVGVTRPLEIHSFEAHPEALEQALALTLSTQPTSGAQPSFAFLRPWAETLQELLRQGKTSLRNEEREHRWFLHQGDFRTFLRADAGARGEFPMIPAPELIFWDLYSPRACPDLWSLEVFQALHRLAPQASLVTYSAATPVRVALLLAGFWVGRPQTHGTATALKNESTMAVGHAELAHEIPSLLGSEWLTKLRHSSTFRPYGEGPLSRADFAEVERQVMAHPQFAG
jgi:tRNA U34 5-methylaminomethyl-2-thiouridine-forming methyltransferase MnmC